MDLEAADARFEPLGKYLDPVAGVDRAGQDGPGDDGAEAAHGEDPVDGHAEDAAVRAWGDAASDLLKGGLELADSGSGQCRDGEDRRLGQKRVADEMADRGRELDDAGLVDEVAFRQGDEAELDAEELEDIEVLTGLDGDPFVGGDDEEGRVDVARPGGHGLDEFLVAGDIDEDDLLRVGRVVEEDEAQLDGHAAGLFLGERVRIGAGQGADEGALSVVDVTGRADDDMVEVGHGQERGGRARRTIRAWPLRMTRPMIAAEGMPFLRRAESTAGALPLRTAMRSPPEVWGS